MLLDSSPDGSCLLNKPLLSPTSSSSSSSGPSNAASISSGSGKRVFGLENRNEDNEEIDDLRADTEGRVLAGGEDDEATG